MLRTTETWRATTVWHTITVTSNLNTVHTLVTAELKSGASDRSDGRM